MQNPLNTFETIIKWHEIRISVVINKKKVYEFFYNYSSHHS